MTYRLKLNQVKEVLGMEIKFETIKLVDGITTIEVEKLEPGFEAYIVAEDGSKTLAPAGEHTLEDGRYIEVDENGVIMEVSTPEEEVEDTTVEVAGSKKFEDAPIDAPVMDVAMAELIETKCAEVAEEKVAEKIEELAKKFAEEKVADIIEEKMKMIFEVVDEVANEVATIKEEMGAFKAKFEKFAKSPATAGPNKVNMPNVTTEFDSFENKVAILKNAMK
jgi:transcriptional regulator of heat shock response